ncbi:MAG: transposase [Lentisphaeria bacterium]|nr:transposase [Lentisphaeria bacterium]
MGKRAKENQAASEGDRRTWRAADPPARSERKPPPQKPKPPGTNPVEYIPVILNRCFPDFWERIDDLPDFRDKDRLYYSLRHLVGLALSVLSAFIENGGEEYDKQDCELKAFYRMAPELKRQFPRLPVCLLLDSLYANETLLDICLGNKRILDVSGGNVVIDCKNYRKEDDKGIPEHIRIPISGIEFIRRFMLHILPDSFKRIRCYGIWAASCKERKLAAARRYLPEPLVLESPDTPSALETPDIPDRFICPHCGVRLRPGKHIIPARAAPVVVPFQGQEGHSHAA